MVQASKQKYIHNYEGQYNAHVKKLNNVNISDKNKKLIFEFEKQCFIKEKVALPTRIKYLDVLTIVANTLTTKDFDKFTKKDFEDIICLIEERDDITVSTKQKYRTILKKFGRWLFFKDKMFIPNGIKKYPETVEWINTNIKSKDKHKIKASEILTEKEIEKLIDSAETPRDKAFIAMLYELGARVGEIGMLNIGDISRDEYSYIIDLSGKTGHRTPRIILADPYLSNWLNQHPFNDQDSPLWVAKNSLSKQFVNKRLNYGALKKIVTRVVRQSGIKKKIYPHLFRHSRVTHLLKEKKINEAQAKVYFGWTPSSKMLSEYSHLVSADVNDTLLEINGIKTEDERKSILKSKTCLSCKKINPKKALFCQYCSKPLDFDTIEKIDELNQKAMDKISGLSLQEFKTIVKIARSFK